MSDPLSIKYCFDQVMRDKSEKVGFINLYSPGSASGAREV
jgi:hypothetical protein